ncbi:MAG TPA: DUF4386 domain-containing protein [Bauldia sp.]
MDQANDPRVIRTLGGAFIAFAVAFNVPYAWLASVFNYPAVLRRPPGEILEAFAAAGTSLILIWVMFAFAALLLAPIAVGVAIVTQRSGRASFAIAELGVAAALAQAIGLSRWVYAVPGLAARWTASPAGSETRAMIEAMFATLHQFAGVGIGEAIGQTLTALWLIAVAIGQLRHPRFGRAIGTVGLIGGIVLLLGLVEGLATVIRFDPGIFSFAALVGFLVLTLWLIWTGVLCIARPAAVG